MELGVSTTGGAFVKHLEDNRSDATHTAAMHRRYVQDLKGVWKEQVRQIKQELAVEAIGDKELGLMDREAAKGMVYAFSGVTDGAKQHLIEAQEYLEDELSGSFLDKGGKQEAIKRITVAYLKERVEHEEDLDHIMGWFQVAFNEARLPDEACLVSLTDAYSLAALPKAKTMADLGKILTVMKAAFSREGWNDKIMTYFILKRYLMRACKIAPDLKSLESIIILLKPFAKKCWVSNQVENFWRDMIYLSFGAALKLEGVSNDALFAYVGALIAEMPVPYKGYLWNNAVQMCYREKASACRTREALKELYDGLVGRLKDDPSASRQSGVAVLELAYFKEMARRDDLSFEELTELLERVLEGKKDWGVGKQDTLIDLAGTYLRVGLTQLEPGDALEAVMNKAVSLALETRPFREKAIAELVGVYIDALSKELDTLEALDRLTGGALGIIEAFGTQDAEATYRRYYDKWQRGELSWRTTSVDLQRLKKIDKDSLKDAYRKLRVGYMEFGMPLVQAEADLEHVAQQVLAINEHEGLGAWAGREALAKAYFRKGSELVMAGKMNIDRLKERACEIARSAELNQQKLYSWISREYYKLASKTLKAKTLGERKENLNTALGEAFRLNQAGATLDKKGSTSEFFADSHKRKTDLSLGTWHTQRVLELEGGREFLREMGTKPKNIDKVFETRKLWL
tara:strand:+ start:91344 stop:93404 length:2061 start_codon:yes stop_codon:yes gene_type:complete